jgi:hypothetical protein
MRDAGLGEALGAGDAERARRGEVRRLADNRRLEALARLVGAMILRVRPSGRDYIAEHDHFCPALDPAFPE